MGRGKTSVCCQRDLVGWAWGLQCQGRGSPSSTLQSLHWESPGTSPHGMQGTRILHFHPFRDRACLWGTVFQRDQRYITAMSQGISLSPLLCPLRHSALHPGWEGGGPWWTTNAMMHAATFRNKPQQGLVNLTCKFSFWSSTHTKPEEDEQPLWPSGRKVWLKNGLAFWFTLAEGWQGQLRAFLPQKLLPTLDLCTQCPHQEYALGPCHPQSDGEILASGNWNPLWLP